MAKTIVFCNKQTRRKYSLVNFLVQETKKQKWQKRGWKPGVARVYASWVDDGQRMHQPGEQVIELTKTDGTGPCARVCSSEQPYKITISHGRPQDIEEIKNMVAGFRSKRTVLIEIV